ncbi:tyrosine-type recombinase/integrase [Nostocaceae cyanobacterium CENA369]|uniref:Tyrosine-type recombinase/integrase n=1 Tax=Dendronalium phyllosphericum CENA369 TaxID=1725256 RepID=A0A8J7LJ61_9NOST|nr:tyrosine-type recombinase/integrase [Dendronalium phyllosphericum]MBH8577294.1 tyrosine-type recombinase/integrase [Dendronalium phyllosphericum CENA369]
MQETIIEAILKNKEPTSYPPCPDCQGEVVSRTSSRGQQEYTCKNPECKRNFSESTKDKPRTELDNPECPDCGSNKVHKKGISQKTGEVKYTCYKCLRSFRDSTRDRKSRLLTEKSRIEKVSKIKSENRPSCPDCNGTWIRKKGIEPTTKEQKYYCNDCTRIFTESTRNKPRPIHPDCPECGSDKVISRGSRAGLPYYRCKSCTAFFKEYSNDPPCPDCQSNRIKKAGTRRNQQQYSCKDCGRRFTESTKDKPSNSQQIFNFESDFWDLREMGVKFPPSTNWFTANFEHITQNWLKQAAKQSTKFNATTRTGGTCLSKLDDIKKFSRFLGVNYRNLNPSEIDRDCILNFLIYLQREYPDSKSINTRREAIKQLDEFIKLSHRFNWLNIANPNLIFPEDLPRLSKSGKTFDQIIPDEVIEQVISNLDGLPIHFARMVLLKLAVPIRVSEVCGMRFDCLRQDAEGDWWLHFWDYKLNKEHNPVPISRELVKVIQAQQQLTKGVVEENYQYLFCARNGAQKKDGTFNYIAHPPGASSFRFALKQFTEDRNITYQGRIYKDLSKTHRFRHTGASELINKGMPLLMVQEILGHETPEMTLVYAKLYDKTLKKTWQETSPKIVDKLV